MEDLYPILFRNKLYYKEDCHEIFVSHYEYDEDLNELTAVNIGSEYFMFPNGEVIKEKEVKITCIVCCKSKISPSSKICVQCEYDIKKEFDRSMKKILSSDSFENSTYNPIQIPLDNKKEVNIFRKQMDLFS